MQIDIKAQTVTHLSLMRTTLAHLQDKTNPSTVKEVLSSGKLAEIDRFVNQAIDSENLSRKDFDEKVTKAWAAYSIFMGGSIPDESVSNVTALQRRIIYLEALEASSA